MKPTLLIYLLLLTLLACNSSKPKKVFVTTDGDPSKTQLLPRVAKDWLSETIKTYDDKDYDKYDNLHYGFSNVLCNDIYSSYKYWEKGESHYDFLSKLNDTQKLYFALINFEGQTNNGGVYQFLFNQPENAVIVLEAMKKAKLDRLAKDYEIVLKEYYGKFETIEELRARFQNGQIGWEERAQSFVDGYVELPQAEVIENYFYEPDYSKMFHKKIAQFVIAHQDALMIRE